MSMLSLNVLTREDIEAVHQSSCRLLSEIGIYIGSPEIADRLVALGGTRGDGDGLVRLSEGMIRDALAACPARFEVSSVTGARHVLGSDARHFSTCIVDPGMNTDSGANRPPTLEDCVRNARIIDSLDLITMPYKMDLAYGGVVGELSVAMSNEAYFSNSTKHVICGPCSSDDARVWMDMAEIMSPSGLEQTPIVSALISPSSPLRLHVDTLQMLTCILEHGVPIICLPCPMCGLTGPLSVAGTLALVNAENLALITVIQMIRLGSRVIYSTCAMPADMTSASAHMSAPEKMLTGLAAAQIGRHYGLPCGTAGASTEVSTFDVQNGAESMSQILLAVLGSAHLITGLGSNSDACGTSAEQILIDCELLTMAEHTRRGIDMNGLSDAIEAIRRTHTTGDFLTDEHTARQCHVDEFFAPDLLDWPGLPGAGNGLYGNAKERARHILEHHVPAVPQDRLAELRKYVESMRR